MKVITYQEFDKLAEENRDKFIYPYNYDKIDKFTLGIIDSNRMFREIFFSEDAHKFLKSTLRKDKQREFDTDSIRAAIEYLEESKCTQNQGEAHQKMHDEALDVAITVMKKAIEEELEKYI